MPAASTGAFPISKGQGVDPAVVAAVYRQGKSMGASQKVMIALFEACLVESNFRNIPYGDRDSVGVLQQRSQGWGTYAERMNPASATQKFVAKAMAMEGRYSTPGRLAQGVQISAFPSRYDAAYPRAISLLNEQNKKNGGTAPPPDTTNPSNPNTDPPGALDNPLALLSDRQTWMRILLIILGLILLFIGIIRMSASDNVTAVAKAGLQFVPGGGVVAKGVRAVASGQPSKVVGAAKSIAKASK